MDVARAQLENTGASVILIDPEWPWTVRVQIGELDGRPVITVMEIIAREQGPPITAAVINQIPVRQIAHVAASALAGEGEAQYRMLARARPQGERSWPAEHFRRVTRVASWARATARPGGEARAVADFWGCSLRTARRWLAHPLAQRRSDAAPPSSRSRPAPSIGR